MKLLSRITAAATLAAPVVLGMVPRPTSVPDTAPTPVTRALLNARGYLKVAVPSAAWPDFLQRPSANHFDYDLVGRLAADLGVHLRALQAADPGAALAQLESGWADAAVLPYQLRVPPSVARAAPCAEKDAGSAAATAETPTLAVYVRSHSKEMLEVFDGGVVRLANADGGDGFFEHYCFEQSFARAEPETGRVARDIAQYARIMGKYADQVGLDWKLVAAVIYEESRFRIHAVSEKGARGLMQLMPWVPNEVGMRSASSPEGNIRAGVLYLARLSEIFSESRGEDRLAIVLAAYLLGPGHMLDAQQLARESGVDPHLWSGAMERIVPLLESPAHYGRTRLGYAQGRHAVVYVNRVLRRYETFKAEIGPAPATARVARVDRAA